MLSKKLILSIGLFLFLILAIPIAVKADSFDEGDYTYVISDGTATIGTYHGNAEEVTLPTSVRYNGTSYVLRTLAPYAFQNNTTLKKLTVPSGITTVGGCAFLNCTSLTTVTFKGTIGSLGSGAFKNCSALSSVTFNGNVADCTKYSIWTGGWENGGYKHSRDHAVFYNAGINSDGITVTFGEGVTRIPAYLFATVYDWSEGVYPRVKKVVMADTVKEVGSYAFYCCYDLKSITWSKGLTDIDSYAFCYDFSIPSVSFPSKLRNIGERAFQYASGMKTVTIPKSTTSVGDYSFEGCSALKTLTINGETGYLGFGAFKNCTSLSGIKITGNIGNCTKYSAWTGDWENGSYRHSRDHSIFYNVGVNTDGITVTFTSGVTRIPSYLFCTAYGWSDGVYPRVTKVVMADTITEVGEYAFYCCYDLKDITWSKNLTAVESNAFAENHALTSVSFPSKVRDIGSRAFIHDTGLETVEFPKSLNSIGNYGFENCEKLTTVTIQGKSQLGLGVFKNCTELTTVNINSNVANCTKYSTWTGSWESGQYRHDYDHSVFYNAGVNGNGITLTFGSGVTRIPSFLFATGRDWSEGIYPKLKKVVMSDTITEVGECAFHRCYDLKTVVWSKELKIIENNAFSCNRALKTLTLPNKVREIHYSAFSADDALTSITLPKSLNSMGDDCFAYNGVLKTVTINGNTALGLRAFKNDTVLSKININGNIPDCSKYSIWTGDWESGGYRHDYDYAVFYNAGVDSRAITVTFGSGVTRVPAYIFATARNSSDTDYAHVTKVVIPDSVTEVGEYAFYSCYSLSNVTVYAKKVAFFDNAFGNCPAAVTFLSYKGSTALTFAKNNGFKAKSFPLPKITAEPKAAYAKPGVSVSFTVKATGSGLKYRWYYRTSSKDSWKKVTTDGYNKNTLPVAATEKNNGFQYRCSVTNSYKSKVFSKAVALNVLNIVKQPAASKTKLNETASFTVKATGGSLKYQWQYKTSASGSWKDVSSKIADYNKATLKVKATASNDGYYYRCAISNKAGSVTSKGAKLTVVYPAPTIKTQPKNVSVELGKSYLITIEASGTGLSYAWYYKDPGDSKYKKAKTVSSAFEGKGTAAQAGRLVYCIVTNKYGSSVKSKTVKVSLK